MAWLPVVCCRHCTMRVLPPTRCQTRGTELSRSSVDRWTAPFRHLHNSSSLTQKYQYFLSLLFRCLVSYIYMLRSISNAGECHFLPSLLPLEKYPAWSILPGVVGCACTCCSVLPRVCLSPWHGKARYTSSSRRVECTLPLFAVVRT